MRLKWQTKNQLQALSCWDVSCLPPRPMLEEEPNAHQLLVMQTHNMVPMEGKF